MFDGLMEKFDGLMEGFERFERFEGLRW